MNRNQKRRWLLTTLFAVSATTFFSVAAQAQSVEGSFTLPCTVHWGIATLPAGSYTFTGKSSSGPLVLEIRGQAGTVMVMEKGRNDARGEGSSLLLQRSGNEATVSSLRLAPYKETFIYASHHRKAVKEETSTLASNKGVATAAVSLIEIPLTVNGQ